MLITPSGIAADRLSSESIAAMPVNAGGDSCSWEGPHAPSSEWRMHRDILLARPDVQAIVHTHAPHATALSMLREPIRAAHYMIAAFGGPLVHCTPYAPFGTQALSDLAIEGLGERHAVLLGNHGMLVTGADLPKAMWRASELEGLARLYLLALSAGRPALLSDAEVEDAIERFKTYGPKESA